jgi:cytochrome c-type biogenesis protein CcmH
MLRLAGVLIVLLGLCNPAFAVNPDEVLDDPVLEQRARELSVGIRCLVFPLI